MMQIHDLPRIGVLSTDPAAVTQFLRRVQAQGGEHAALLPLSPAGVPVLSTAGAALQQLVGKLRQRASVLCTPGVRAANVYGLAARRYGLHCGYPDAPVQALLGCIRPEKACSEQVLRSIIELELARGSDSVVLDSAPLCAAFRHFGLAARYPQAVDGMELLAQAALLQTAAASGIRQA